MIFLNIDTAWEEGMNIKKTSAMEVVVLYFIVAKRDGTKFLHELMQCGPLFFFFLN